MLSRNAALLLVLAIFGLGLAFFTRNNTFDFYCHPDEFGKVRQLVKGERNIHHPMWMLTTADFARRALLRGGDKRNFQKVVVVGRWLTAGAAALAAAALALLAARQYGLAAGWLAGLLTLSNSLLFELAHYFKEDPWLAAGLAFTALALHFHQRKPDNIRLGWVAAAAATAAAGKYLGFAVLPFVIASFWKQPGVTAPGDRRRRLTRFFLIFSGVWLALNYWVLKTPGKVFESLNEEMEKAYGNEMLDHGSHILQFYRNLQSGNGGWMVPALAGLWVLFALLHRRRIPAAEWTLAGVSLLFFIILSFTPKVSERYYLPIATSLCYFAVAGVMAWASQFRWKSPRWVAAVLVLTAGIFQAQATLKSWGGFKSDDREQLQNWITANLPADAVIAQDDAVNLPELERLAKKHEGREALEQKVIGARKLVTLGGIRGMRAMGVTHVAICYRIYGRYLDGTLNVADGDGGGAAIRDLYQTLVQKGHILWEMPLGENPYLQPGLSLIDIRGIEIPPPPADGPPPSSFNAPPPPSPSPP